METKILNSLIFRYGGAEAATLCAVSSLSHHLEYDKTANIYMYTKLYHNKRPGIWSTPDSILLIYKILALFPKGFEISKHTALRTEFDDSMVTATPDLFSNGNHFANGNGNGNGNGNSMMVMMRNDGENGDLSVVVTSDVTDNLMITN